jgi:cytochrome P450
MLATEGHVHKRQRRVATPAFSKQNMRALVPVVFNKGEELKDRWMGLIQEQSNNKTGIRLDVCHWVSRATFDVIGMSGTSQLLLVLNHELTILVPC